MKHSEDVLLIDRPVHALRDEYPAAFVDPMHTHDHVQILYASAGVMLVRTPETSFVVPPQRAVWLPVGMPHEVQCRGAVSLRTLYLHADLDDGARGCRVFEVSPLLRALILETINLKPLYDRDGRDSLIIRLLLDEIRRMPSVPCHAPMPTDPRLLRVATILLANPTDPRDINAWAAVAGMSRPTFTRSFKRETGMGLALWRQQVRLMEALAKLAMGVPITQAAFDVGYDSASGFSAMFRRTFGSPPTVYLGLAARG